MQVKIYAIRPDITKGKVTRKTQQIESLLTYENTKRIAEIDTGVIYPDFDTAMNEIGKKNSALAAGLKAEQHYTLTLNGRILRSDFESWEAAEIYAADVAERIYQQPTERKKFPWGFKFRIRETLPGEKLF